MITEITSLKQIPQYLEDEAFVFFDIDNTLIATTHKCGSDLWEAKIIERLMQIMPKEEAISRASLIWHALQYISHICPVEAEMPLFIQSLRNQGNHVAAITMRNKMMIELTKRQLTSFGYQFSFKKKHLPKEASNDLIFIDGIIFCEGINKGLVLRKFFEMLPKRPEKLLLIDDSLNNLVQVEEAMKEISIGFIGLKYNHLDTNMSEYELDEFSSLFCKIMGHPHSRKLFIEGISL